MMLYRNIKALVHSPDSDFFGNIARVFQGDSLAPYCDAKGLLLCQNGILFHTCEDGAGWHLIPYRISPRSEFFSQAYKTWHITWGINLGPDWPPLARGSKFHTIHTPTKATKLPPLDNRRYGPIGFSRNNIIL